MNTIRAIVHSSLRGYRTHRGNNHRTASAISSKRQIEMIQEHMPLEQFDNDENKDFDDIDSHESDFSNVGEYDKMHQRELYIQKEKLKYQIVKRKYFKSKEPAMLTWGEKEQIRLLHNQDPDEWSVERLSESFPASYDTVLKILRAKWMPPSIKIIENYEKKVKNNWNLFKAGKLAVDPQLQAHLEKFKDRKINIMDEETMRKFLKPKPVFPKPKSVMFSNLIQGYLDEHGAKKESKERERNIKESMRKLPEITSGLDDTLKVVKTGQPVESLTLNMFLKRHIEGVNENDMTPVDRVIVDEYKQRSAEAYKSSSLVLESQSAVNQVEITREETNENSDDADIPTFQTNAVANSHTGSLRGTAIRTIDENSIETGIIARHKRENVTADDYPQYIKIPDKKYKRGVTYRVEDRYYDDDGEFLYRVPGLIS